MATNRLRHFNGCSIEELEPSHLQPRDECPAIDGLSYCSIRTCGHMRPPSKGWLRNLRFTRPSFLPCRVGSEEEPYVRLTPSPRFRGVLPDRPRPPVLSLCA